MAIILNDNIRVNAPKPQEDKRMNNGVPYTSVAQANSLLNPVVDRYESLEVVIGTPSNWSIYWYKDGVADSDLVLKQESDVTAAGNNNFTGQNTFEEITDFNSAIRANGGIETPMGVFFLDGVKNLRLDAPTITDNRTVTFQDGNGTLAFLSDIPTVNEYFRGKFPSKVALDGNIFTPPLKAGDYAQVDTGAGSDVVNYSWDADDEVWVEGGSGSAATDTDMLPEGSTNLYFTVARVLATLLTGYSVGSNVAIATTDTLLQALGKVQAQINAKLSTDFSNITGVPTNTGNAYSVTVPATLPSPPLNGQPILFKPQAVNTGAATLAVNGGTAYPIKKGETTDLASGDLQAGKNYMLHFNTANNSWQILGELRNDNILNQTASLQTGGFYTGTGRLDTGLGLGIAPNSGAFETVAAATSAKAQLLLTQGTENYSGSVNGMFWNNAGELRFVDNGIANRVFKWYNNELGKSDGNYVVTLNQYGDASANIKVTERWVYDTDVLDAITAASWSSDRAILTPANSKIMYKGQRHDDGTYSYEAIDDNKIRRW